MGERENRNPIVLEHGGLVHMFALGAPAECNVQVRVRVQVKVLPDQASERESALLEMNS